MRYAAWCDTHQKRPRSNEEKKGKKEEGREGAELRLLRESSAQLGIPSSGSCKTYAEEAVWLSQDALPLELGPTSELCGSCAPVSQDTFSLQYLLYSELYGHWASKTL